jgi:hypothetical protein
VAFLVDIPDPQPKVVRVYVTFKDQVLSEIDDHANRRRMTRAGFLAEAAPEKLRHRG